MELLVGWRNTKAPVVLVPQAYSSTCLIRISKSGRLVGKRIIYSLPLFCTSDPLNGLVIWKAKRHVVQVSLPRMSAFTQLSN